MSHEWLFPEIPDIWAMDTMESDCWAFERQAKSEGYAVIAGVDEAGRGPLAGPVVSAAVVIPPDFSAPGITDSKKLSPSRRDALYQTIYANAITIGIGIVDAMEIDRINILRASLLAMTMAVDNLWPRPDYLLIDGTFPIDLDIAQQPIVKGDRLSISISAASIVAKVTRDRIMDEYHGQYPWYGFNRHKGYPTKAHKEAIQKYGCCPIHRRSFKPVRQFCVESP